MQPTSAMFFYWLGKLNIILDIETAVHKRIRLISFKKIPENDRTLIFQYRKGAIRYIHFRCDKLSVHIHPKSSNADIFRKWVEMRKCL